MQDAVQELLSNALQINISARVFPPDQQPVWNVEKTKLTLPGRAVDVSLEGDNVRIYLVCTPYTRQNTGDVLLLAQGQVWLTQPPDPELKYYATVYSIPVSYGQKVVYYPLGVPGEVKDPQILNIEMEIQVVPYKENQ